MFKTRTRRLPTAAAVSVIGLIPVLGHAAAPLRAEDDDLPLRFDAIAANLSNVGPRGQTRIDITVAACKKLDDDFLLSNRKRATSAETLLAEFESLGPEPYIESQDRACRFSASDYARRWVREM